MPEAEQIPNKSNRMVNRIRAIMRHTRWYSSKGRSRLAHDANISRSALDRILRGIGEPSFRVVSRIVGVLERDLGMRIDPREMVNEDPKGFSCSTCELVGCPGCAPVESYYRCPVKSEADLIVESKVLLKEANE